MKLLPPTFLSILLFACQSASQPDHRHWEAYLGDKGRTHYSALDQVNTQNVQQLQVAWIYHTGDADTINHSQLQCNPIIVNGILYGTTPRLKLFALNAVNGKELWSFNPFADTAKMNFGLNINRGVTYWEEGNDKRILYTAGSYLFAINAQTGKLVMKFGQQGKVDLHEGLDDAAKNLFVVATSPGVVYQDIFILGSRVSEGTDAAPGYIRAYDVRTGKIRWVFHTIPQPGEDGYESWEDKEAWKKTGGANSWAGISLDEERGIAYIPLGSATPDFYGGLRKGADLFSDCLLALDARTGRRLWHYQTVHHDVWDRDLPCPPTLVTLSHKGKKVDALAQPTKTGFLFLLDRKTGQPLFPVEEKPVPQKSDLKGEQLFPTQPIPARPAPYVKQALTVQDLNPYVPAAVQDTLRMQLQQMKKGHVFAPPSLEGTLLYPGFDGGAEWGGATFDPETGLLYINSNQVPWILKMIPTAAQGAAHESMITAGKRIYLNNCAVCHGAHREGGGQFPALELQHVKNKYSAAGILQLLNNGRRMMPGFKQLPEEDKQALIDFLLDQQGEQKEYVSKGEHAPSVPYTMAGYTKWRTPDGYPASRPPWGTLTAIDLNKGVISWQIPLGEYPELTAKGIPPTGTENYGGAVATKGGLLFIAATRDSQFRAFNKQTGQLLWQTQLPAPGFATPAVYEANGRQYIVIACGGGKLGTRSGDAYLAFALPRH